MTPEQFKELRQAYPKRKGDNGWVECRNRIDTHLENGESWEEMLRGAHNYRKFCAENQEDTRFIKQARTFFGPNMWWLEWQEMPDDENTVSVDDEAEKLGLVRGEGEDDESLKRRIGIAQTMLQYNIREMK